MKELSKEEKKAQRRKYYLAHREEILRKYREKKEKLTPEDRIQIWTEQLQAKLENTKDELIKFWLERQINFNKKILDGESEKTDICL